MSNLNNEFADTNSKIFDQATVSVTTTEVEATTGADINDVQYVRIYNSGNSEVFVGKQGKTLEPLQKRQWIEYALNCERVYVRTQSGTGEVIVTELG